AGTFPVEFSTTTTPAEESSAVLHYLAFIKRAGRKSWRSTGCCFLIIAYPIRTFCCIACCPSTN
ncbi:hypothetical protein F9940_11330, partial [Bacteroides stercoris]